MIFGGQILSLTFENHDHLTEDDLTSEDEELVSEIVITEEDVEDDLVLSTTEGFQAFGKFSSSFFQPSPRSKLFLIQGVQKRCQQ